MTPIAILSEFSEVIVAISHLITPGHRVIQRCYPFDLPDLFAEGPGAIVIPLFRVPDAVARPIENFERDVAGASILVALQEGELPEACPLIIVGLGVLPQEVPQSLRYHSFLTFPQAIQELNPLISSLIGPAPQPTRYPAWPTVSVTKTRPSG